MQIFADTADIAEIKRWLHYGVLDGVTTNPTILLAEGAYNLKERTREIAALLGDRPVSAEVVSDDVEDMVTQAREIASWASNIVVKIPIITTQGEPCLGAIRILAEEGIRVNATACLSFGQAILAAKAGAAYVSLFSGRISDEGGNAWKVVYDTAEWLTQWKHRSKIIVGSIREAINIQDAALAGAHVIAVSPKFLQQLVDHKYSRFTVQQFLDHGREAAERLEVIERTNGRAPAADQATRITVD
jgi:transaldolase